MKYLCLICSLVFVFTSCERHSVNELKSIEPEHHSAEHHSAEHEKEAKH